MSIVVTQNGNEKLRLRPKEFRRMYTLSFCDDCNTKELVYSHSDCVCELPNGSNVMAEIVQTLDDGTYEVTSLPTEQTFNLEIKQKQPECVLYLKRIIFMNFVDLPTKDIYLNTELRVPHVCV